MSDVWTVCRKEMREWTRVKGNTLYMLVLTVVFGVFLPLTQVEAWKVPSPFLAFYFFFLPSMLASTSAADSFAGERERKTLETLLATRLFSRDIFLGKLLATILHTASLMLVIEGLMLIVLNAGSSPGMPPFLFPPLTLFALGPLAWGVTWLVTNLGLFVSMKVLSTRTAQQIGSIGSLFIVLPFMFGLVQFAFTWRLLLALFGAVLAAASVATLVSLALFQRDRLI